MSCSIHSPSSCYVVCRSTRGNPEVVGALRADFQIGREVLGVMAWLAAVTLNCAEPSWNAARFLAFRRDAWSRLS